MTWELELAIYIYLYIYNVNIYISKYLYIYSGLRVPAPLPAGLLVWPILPGPGLQLPRPADLQTVQVSRWVVHSVDRVHVSSRSTRASTCPMSPWDSSSCPPPSIKPHIRSPHIFCVLSGAKLLPFATSSSQPFVFQRYEALHWFIYAILGTKIESLSHLRIQERQ